MWAGLARFTCLLDLRDRSGNLSVGGVISQLIAGGAGGAILTAIIGAIKNKVAA